MVFGMSGFDKYVEQLVNGEEPIDDFPKNESSWEELYNFGEKRVSEIVALKRSLSTLQKRVEEAEKNSIDLQNKISYIGTLVTLWRDKSELGEMPTDRCIGYDNCANDLEVFLNG